jgi:thiamine biosynthesis protein ThiI
MECTAVLRLSGEVSTKARATRREFVTRLIRNAKDALRSEGLPCEIERSHERLYIKLPGPEGATALARVFGVQSVAIATRTSFTGLDDLVERAAEHFRDAVRGRTFAVRARLIGGEKPGFRARDVERELGTALLPEAARVDLSHPELTARVELHQGSAHLIGTELPGPAGLPLGVEGRALALVSGGFDSAVAAWQLLRRGVNLDYLFCNLGGRSHELGVLRVMQEIARHWSYGVRPRLYALDFDPVVRSIRECAEPRLWQILLKREMLRAAERVAQETGAEALVTGDAVGQVSSQTLTNLSVISGATQLPILRPLVGTNKDEIVRQAHAIGTGPLSAVVAEYCAIVSRKPATAAKRADVESAEAGLDRTALEKAVVTREVLDLRDVDADARVYPDLEISELPDGAVPLDLRSRPEYDTWHAPEALHMEFGAAQRAYASFSSERQYVLYCEYGLKSAHLAELMREAGLRAHHFKGGTRALRRWVEKRSGQ